MKTILFIPSAWYLSLQLYRKLGIILGSSVKTVLLETGDPYFVKQRNLNIYDKEWFEKSFNHSYFLSFPNKEKGYLYWIFQQKKYQWKLKEIINKHKPDLILTDGDRTNFYPIITRMFPSIQIAIIQVALLHVDYFLEENKLTATSPQIKFKSNLKKNLLIVFRNYFKTFIFRIIGICSYTYDTERAWGMVDDNSLLFLWGNMTKDLFKRSKKKCFVIGNILTDNLYNYYFCNKKDKNIIGKANFNINDKIILIATRDLMKKDENNVLKWYDEITRYFKNYKFIFKVHPSDDIDVFTRYFDNNHIKLIKNEFAFHELLQISDLSISHYSATAMDSLLFGIPTILLPNDVLSKNDKNYWFKSDVFIKPNNPIDCCKKIEQIFDKCGNKQNNEIREKFLRQMFSDNIGQSSDSMRAEINKLLYN